VMSVSAKAAHSQEQVHFRGRNDSQHGLRIPPATDRARPAGGAALDTDPLRVRR
jgi:hypothetical protein